MAYLKTGGPSGLTSCILHLASYFSLFMAFCLLLLASCSRAPEGMVLIPAGEFVMGTEEVDVEARSLQFGSKKPWYLNEKPMRKVSLETFYIDKYEVTNREYKEFVDATGHAFPENWQRGAYPDGQNDYPVMLINWYDAYAYCKWKGRRLPTEAEWEKSARGIDGRRFPWGNEYDPKKANAQGEFGGPITVGSFETGKSPYGVYDMSGNVAEWVEDWYKPYPDNNDVDEDYGEKFKVIRGGGWGGVGHYNLSLYRRTSYRFYADPKDRFKDVGFRCAR